MEIETAEVGVWCLFLTLEKNIYEVNKRKILYYRSVGTLFTFIVYHFPIIPVCLVDGAPFLKTTKKMKCLSVFHMLLVQWTTTYLGVEHSDDLSYLYLYVNIYDTETFTHLKCIATTYLSHYKFPHFSITMFNKTIHYYYNQYNT